MVADLDPIVSIPPPADRHRLTNRMTWQELDQLASGLLFLLMFFLALALIVNWL